MENSPLISRLAAYGDLQEFVRGPDAERRPVARIAWSLEGVAVSAGWQTGHSLGSETNLMQRFDADRERIREAVKIVEARGAMTMHRGRRGGLHLKLTEVDRAAAALSTYLRASACGGTELAETVQVADTVFAGLSAENLMVRLFRRTLDALDDFDAVATAIAGRGAEIAAQMIRLAAPLPSEGVRLGSEALLCERFSCGQTTMRQALRILDDLGMLAVQRGRGGGYSLKRPSRIGASRQLFALFASHRQTLADIVPMVWAINIANLRLAIRKLERLDARERRTRCDQLVSLLAASSSEPHRWSALQLALAETANSPMMGTLLCALVTYQARLGAPSVVYEGIAEPLRDEEKAIVDALRRGAGVEAEQVQREAQRRLSLLLRCPDLGLGTE